MGDAWGKPRVRPVPEPPGSPREGLWPLLQATARGAWPPTHRDRAAGLVPPWRPHCSLRPLPDLERHANEKQAVRSRHQAGTGPVTSSVSPPTFLVQKNCFQATISQCLQTSSRPAVHLKLTQRHPSVTPQTPNPLYARPGGRPCRPHSLLRLHLPPKDAAPTGFLETATVAAPAWHLPKRDPRLQS